MGEHWEGRINPRGLWKKGTRAEELPELFADEELGQRRRDWFFSYVRSVGDCEEWMGGHLSFGYGVVNIGGVTHRAHRVAFALHNGIDPGELRVCHECDNPPCIKKTHLFLGTQADNNRDCAEKGRLRPVRGERAFNAVLTEKKVRELWKLHDKGWGTRRIGKKFGIARSTIRSVILGETWAHVAHGSANTKARRTVIHLKAKDNGGLCLVVGTELTVCGSVLEEAVVDEYPRYVTCRKCLA